jgi:hypothetical protein
MKNSTTAHPILAPYISEPAKAPMKRVRIYRGVIPRRAALIDLAQLRYVIDNRYSGKEYWERKGISFEDCYAQISALIESRSEIYVSDFCRAIHNAFNVGIVDNHFCFASPMTGRLGFSKVYTAWFADILVEQISGTFIVAACKDQRITTGSRIINTECLFPTLSPAGREYFLVGCRSWEPIDSMRLQIDDAVVTVDVHKCRASATKKSGDICLAKEQKDGIDIVRSNCCDFVPPLDKKADIAVIGRTFADSDILIWDNLSNEGGYSRIPREFIHGLNGYVCCEEYSAKLTSPLIKGRPSKRKWILSDADACEPEKGKYNGTLYFLMNSDTGSSGETSVLYAKSLKHAVFVGENSMGCNTFGNVASYQLKNSGIVMCVPNMINLCRNPDDCVEGKGFSPDYWVDALDVQAEVIRWLKNREAYVPVFG